MGDRPAGSRDPRRARGRRVGVRKLGIVDERHCSSSTPSQPGLTQDSQSPQQQPNGDDCPNGGGQQGQGQQGQGQQQDQSTAPDTTTQTPDTTTQTPYSEL
jgi:hypothetical protein